MRIVVYVDNSEDDEAARRIVPSMHTWLASAVNFDAAACYRTDNPQIEIEVRRSFPKPPPVEPTYLGSVLHQASVYGMVSDPADPAKMRATISMADLASMVPGLDASKITSGNIAFGAPMRAMDSLAAQPVPYPAPGMPMPPFPDQDPPWVKFHEEPFYKEDE